MSNAPQSNPWQPVGRGGRQQQQQSQHHAASRTPQNRSTTASPSQNQPPAQPPKQQPQPQHQEAKPPTSNAWANRSAAVTSSGSNHSSGASTPTGSAPNGPANSRPVSVMASSSSAGPSSSAAGATEDPHTPLNGFNAAEVKAFLARGGSVSVYKSAGPGNEAGARNSGSGGAWSAKPSNMANNQPFFVQLAKQVAAFEGGG